MRLPNDVKKSQYPGYQAGSDLKLRNSVLRLGLLSDQLIIVHSGESSEADMSWQGAVNQGLLGYASPSDQLKYRELPSIEAFWTSNSDVLTELQPLIISQLRSRNKLPDEDLFHLWLSERTQNASALERVQKSKQHRGPKDWAALKETAASPLMDVLVLSTISEISSAEAYARKTNTRVALARPSGPGAGFNAGANDHIEDVHLLVVDALLEEGLFIPQPSSLTELSRLREKKEVQDFRAVFAAWVACFARVDYQAEQNLRREIKQAAFVFRNEPRLSRLSDIGALVSIALGPSQPWSAAMIGAGALGLQKLASRWKGIGNWVSFCQPITKA